MDMIDAGTNANTVLKTFHAKKEEVVGALAHFDGDSYTIDFRRK